MSFTLVVDSTSAASSGVAINPRVIKSSDEYPLGSRGSLMASAAHRPPSGLKIRTSYPCSENQKYGCVSSLHQKPTGHPVVVEVAGFEITMAIRLRNLGLTTFGSLRLILCLLDHRSTARTPIMIAFHFAAPSPTPVVDASARCSIASGTRDRHWAKTPSCGRSRHPRAHLRPDRRVQRRTEARPESAGCNSPANAGWDVP